MKLGNIAATITVAQHFDEHGLDFESYIERYMKNDWGDLDDSDKFQNDIGMFALTGFVIAKYKLPTGIEILFETQWSKEDRNTVIMLPSER